MKASSAVTALVQAYQPFYQLPQAGFIGWGHRITGEYEVRDYANGITISQAENLLAFVIQSSVHYFNEILGRLSLTLSQSQYDALISLFIQAPHLNSSFLLKHIRNKDSVGIVKEWVKWGQFLHGTEARRAAELRLFQTGTFTE